MKKKNILTLAIGVFLNIGAINVANAETYTDIDDFPQMVSCEVIAEKLGDDPEKLLKAIEGEFSCKCKKLFASRLYDLSTLTPEEEKRVKVGMRNIHELMFFGDNVKIPIVDTNKAELVDKGYIDGYNICN